MASENLRSTSKKMQKEIAKELGVGANVATKLITFIEASLRDQQSFIENQFASFVGRLNRIQAVISTCMADIKTLYQECIKLHTRFIKVESAAIERHKLEAALTQQEAAL